MAGKAGRGSEQFMIRLPEGMRDSIKEAAGRNGRSMNAEIISRLEGSSEMQFIIDHLHSELAIARAELDAARVSAVAAWTKVDEELTKIQSLSQRRIPEGLFARIKRQSEIKGRSIEEEIVQALESVFPPAPTVTPRQFYHAVAWARQHAPESTLAIYPASVLRFLSAEIEKDPTWADTPIGSDGLLFPDAQPKSPSDDA